MAPKLGKELCHQFIVFEMMSLMDHQESIIRKKCLECLIPVCQNLESYFLESKLIPMYSKFELLVSLKTKRGKLEKQPLKYLLKSIIYVPKKLEVITYLLYCKNI